MKIMLYKHTKLRYNEAKHISKISTHNVINSIQSMIQDHFTILPRNQRMESMNYLCRSKDSRLPSSFFNVITLATKTSTYRPGEKQRGAEEYLKSEHLSERDKLEKTEISLIGNFKKPATYSKNFLYPTIGKIRVSK